MRQLVYIVLLVMIAFLVPNKSAAQSELVIYASLTEGTTLDAIIAADQSSANPHEVYKLVSTDTCYIFNNTITIDNDVTILGVTGTEDRLPCIQPNVLTGGDVPGQLFVFSKAGAVIKLQNLYLLGASVENTINSAQGMAVTFTGNNQKAYIDNVVMEQWGQFCINFSGQNFSLWATSNVFRNCVNTGSVYTGEALRMRNDLGVTEVDTIVMQNNIFIAVNAYAQCVPVGGYSKYIEFTHNTLVGFVKNPFFSMPVSNWKCDYNILYDVYVGGMANGEYPWWDNLVGGLSSVIDLSPMSIANAARFGIDTLQANWSETAEAARTISVSNNIYYKTPAIADAVDEWNLTHTGTDSIHVVPWMNELTDSMFNDDETWPGLVDEGNLLDTDPIFGQDITTMIGAPGTNVPEEDFGVGLIPYILAARGNGGVANATYGFYLSSPDYSQGVWTPTWPLPEKAALNYQADLTAPDGKNYGHDPSFVTGVEETKSSKVVTTYKLNQNFPNPFNPSTTISFELPENGYVSLKIYDIMGREVYTVVNNSFKTKGGYNYKIDFSNLPSGIYFYTLQQNDFIQTKKMTLLK